jgi:hypothetical protein
MRDTVDVTERPDNEHLDSYEQRARYRLEPVLGFLRVIDRKGGPPGLHDLEADLPAGVAAVEITSEVESARLDLAASAHRRLSTLTLRGSGHRWQVGLAADARVNAIRPAALLELLSDMEQAGRWRALSMGDYRDPFVERLRQLGIESVYGFKTKPGRGGAVTVGPGFYGGRGWNATAIDAWLGNLLASSQGANKVSKLARAINAAERHLVIVLDPFSRAGVGISLALTDHQEEGSAYDTIPSLVPPEPLTHLWLLPVMGPDTALCWVRQHGWAVTNPVDSMSESSNNRMPFR